MTHASISLRAERQNLLLPGAAGGSVSQRTLHPRQIRGSATGGVTGVFCQSLEGENRPHLPEEELHLHPAAGERRTHTHTHTHTLLEPAAPS